MHLLSRRPVDIEASAGFHNFTGSRGRRVNRVRDNSPVARVYLSRRVPFEIQYNRVATPVPAVAILEVVVCIHRRRKSAWRTTAHAVESLQFARAMQLLSLSCLRRDTHPRRCSRSTKFAHGYCVWPPYRSFRHQYPFGDYTEGDSFDRI